MRPLRDVSDLSAPVPADPRARPATSARTSLIRFERVAKRFGGVTAVDDVSLDIREGEFFCLLGPSGCGKTTLMRMLAGFEEPDAGRVMLAGEDLAGTPPHRRPVNMMFQSYALFPHLTVTGNIAFGLKQEGRRKAEIAARVAEMLRLVQLEPCATRYPHQLSGGQRQRVALARALAKRPKVLLLDEPLAALDRKLREETQFELKEIQARLGTTFLVVTHDQHEAMAMADRIAVMDQGRIVQIGAPDEIYEAPVSRFVARFVGDVNLLDGRLRGREGSQVVIDSAVAPEGLLVESAAEAGQGGAVAVAVRPEKMAIHRERPAAERNVLSGEVVDFSYLGDWTMVRVRLDRGETVRVSRQNASRATAAPLAPGERVYLSFASDAAVVLTR